MKEHFYVFCAMVVLDMLWTLYVMATATHAALLSATWAAIIIVVSGFVTRAYVKDKKFLIPASIGAFVGTWIAITFFK